MDKIIIEAKIDSILRCVDRVKSRLPETPVLFMKDLDAQDVVVLNISRCVQLAVDIAMYICSILNDSLPHTMGQSFDVLLRMTVINEHIDNGVHYSFRNIAVNNYDDIDLNLSYEIAHDHMGDFIEYVQQVQSYMERNKF